MPHWLGFDSVSPAERFGRNDLVDGNNSKSRTTSCASCHMDGHQDGIVWNLGVFLDPEGTPKGSLAFPLDDFGDEDYGPSLSLAFGQVFGFHGNQSTLATR